MIVVGIIVFFFLITGEWHVVHLLKIMEVTGSSENKQTWPFYVLVTMPMAVGKQSTTWASESGFLDWGHVQDKGQG